MRRLLALLLLLAVALRARAAEPFLKPNDVIALVGGEDMVVANELGYLETLLQRALPAYHLKVRSLAWEGDTVFEQHRDLNYPTLETQLDKIGATVVICHFGVVESLAGPEKIPEFIAAYQKLLARLDRAANPVARRRFVLVGPLAYGKADDQGRAINQRIEAGYRDMVNGPMKTRFTYGQKIDGLAEANRILTMSMKGGFSAQTQPLRDGLHLSEKFQRALAENVVAGLVPSEVLDPFGQADQLPALTSKVREKNRLWFQYTRPQNWAFLAGDRTNQPSSRDYRDPSKRWFPDEMEQFVPLIDAKDKEIWEMAAQLNAK